MILLVNYLMSNCTMGMMLNAMANRRYKPLKQPIILILFIPLIAYHLLGVSAEVEMKLTAALTIYSFILFYARVTLLSIQWC